MGFWYWYSVVIRMLRPKAETTPTWSDVLIKFQCFSFIRFLLLDFENIYIARDSRACLCVLLFAVIERSGELTNVNGARISNIKIPNDTIRMPNKLKNSHETRIKIKMSVDLSIMAQSGNSVFFVIPSCSECKQNSKPARNVDCNRTFESDALFFQSSTNINYSANRNYERKITIIYEFCYRSQSRVRSKKPKSAHNVRRVLFVSNNFQ